MGTVDRIQEIDRRDFLKLVGAGLGATALAAIGGSAVLNYIQETDRNPTGLATSGSEECGSPVPSDALNVTDYGATGDGSTDDTAAVQAAIDDAEAGDTIYLPAGTYLVRGQHRVVSIDVPDNVTIQGDGADTVIQYGGGNGGNNFTVMRVTGWIDGLTIRDLVVDGGRNQATGSPVAGGALGLNPDGSGTGSYAIINCEFRNALRSGLGVRANNTVVERVTAHGNGRHGIGANVDISDQPVEIRHCHTYNNGLDFPTYGIDASTGSIRIYDCVTEDNAQGTKVSDGDIDAEYHRVRIQNNDGMAFQSTNTFSGTVVFDKVVFGPGNTRVRGSGNVDYVIPDGSEIVVTGNTHDNAAFQIHENATLDASGATIWSNNNAGAGLSCFSDKSGNVIGTYNHANNAGGPLRRTDNLEIRQQNEREKTDIAEVPTASEVGAFNGCPPPGGDRGDDGSSDPDPGTGSGTSGSGSIPPACLKYFRSG